MFAQMPVFEGLITSIDNVLNDRPLIDDQSDMNSVGCFGEVRSDLFKQVGSVEYIDVSLERFLVKRSILSGLHR